jgi:hypothetical protein
MVNVPPLHVHRVVSDHLTGRTPIQNPLRDRPLLAPAVRMVFGGRNDCCSNLSNSTSGFASWSTERSDGRPDHVTVCPVVILTGFGPN